MRDRAEYIKAQAYAEYQITLEKAKAQAELYRIMFDDNRDVFVPCNFSSEERENVKKYNL